MSLFTVYLSHSNNSSNNFKAHDFQSFRHFGTLITHSPRGAFTRSPSRISRIRKSSYTYIHLSSWMGLGTLETRSCIFLRRSCLKFIFWSRERCSQSKCTKWYEESRFLLILDHRCWNEEKMPRLRWSFSKTHWHCLQLDISRSSGLPANLWWQTLLHRCKPV